MRIEVSGVTASGNAKGMPVHLNEFSRHGQDDRQTTSAKSSSIPVTPTASPTTAPSEEALRMAEDSGSIPTSHGSIRPSKSVSKTLDVGPQDSLTDGVSTQVKEIRGHKHRPHSTVLHNLALQDTEREQESYRRYQSSSVLDVEMQRTKPTLSQGYKPVLTPKGEAPAGGPISRTGDGSPVELSRGIERQHRQEQEQTSTSTWQLEKQPQHKTRRGHRGNKSSRREERVTKDVGHSHQFGSPSRVSEQETSIQAYAKLHS